MYFKGGGKSFFSKFIALALVSVLLLISIYILIYKATSRPTLSNQDATLERCPVKISDLSNRITSVHYDKNEDLTEIVFEQSSMWNHASVVFMLSEMVFETSKGIQQCFKQIKSQHIGFTAKIPVVDDLNNTHSVKVLMVQYRLSDLYHAPLKKLEKHQFLNRYDKVIYLDPRAYSFINAYCQNNVEKPADKFCLKQNLILQQNVGG